MQALPLSAKIRMTINRLRDAYDYYDGMLYVSRSGGKDSDVLGDIVKEHFSDIPHVFINTGLEDNSVRRHGIKIADVVLTPPMNFVDIITTYGYPVISKEIAGKFYDLQRAKENGTDSYVLKQLEGTYVSKNGKTNMIDIKKYAFLKDAPFRISNQCCIQSKEAAARKYEKETGRTPIVGTMATESMYRYQSWIKYGCNAFESKRPQSRPLSFWTEQDVLQYIKEHDLKIADAYGRVTYQDDAGLFYDNPFITDGLSLTTTEAKRTGCVFCMFGIAYDTDRFLRLKATDLQKYDFVMRGGKFDDKGYWVPDNGLGYKFVIDWLNEHGGLNIRY